MSSSSPSTLSPLFLGSDIALGNGSVPTTPFVMETINHIPDLKGDEVDPSVDANAPDLNDDKDKDKDAAPAAVANPEEEAVLGWPKLYHAVVYTVLKRPLIMDPYKANQGRSWVAKRKQGLHLKFAMDVVGNLFNYEKACILRKGPAGTVNDDSISGQFKAAINLNILTGAAHVEECNRQEPFYGICKVHFVCLPVLLTHADHNIALQQLTSALSNLLGKENIWQAKCI
jgi:hypothetical protein